MEFRDYYATLGVDRRAGADEIRKAYRRLARKYHPDVSKESDAAARMQEVNEAWAVLGDPERRAAYDRLDRARQAGAGFEGGFGHGFGRRQGMHEPSGFAGGGFSAADAAAFSDFFASLFGDDLRPRARHRRHAAADQHASIELDLEDAWRGCSREIELQLPRFAADGQVSVETRRLAVRIPPGVGDGQRIRLAGQGLPGDTGRSGDLLLEVRLRPHPRFRVVGRDLHLSLPIAPWEAALGGIVGVELPDRSQVRVRIPAGAQSGRQLRVRGHGLPGQPSAQSTRHAAGDLLLDLRIVVPPADTARARELYAAMARELAFDPRAVGD